MYYIEAVQTVMWKKNIDLDEEFKKMEQLRSDLIFRHSSLIFYYS